MTMNLEELFAATKIFFKKKEDQEYHYKCTMKTHSFEVERLARTKRKNGDLFYEVFSMQHRYTHREDAIYVRKFRTPNMIYEKFDHDELKFFDMLGLKIVPTQSEGTRQKIEDWIYDD